MKQIAYDLKIKDTCTTNIKDIEEIKSSGLFLGFKVRFLPDNKPGFVKFTVINPQDTEKLEGEIRKCRYVQYYKTKIEVPD